MFLGILIFLNDFRTKGREVKDGFDRLERLAAQGPNHKEFIEPKVQNLWMQAVKSNFTRDEIESLRVGMSFAFVFVSLLFNV